MIFAELPAFELLLDLIYLLRWLSIGDIDAQRFLDDFSPLSVELTRQQLSILHDFLEFLITQTHHHILRFEISMYDPANPMQEVQPLEHLPRNLLTDIHRHALIVVPLDDLQQVATKDLKDHAEMIAILRLMYKCIEQAHNMRVVSALPPLLAMRDLLNLLQDLDLVEGCLHVMWRALLDLYGDVCAIFEVLAQPDCREVAPAQFLDDHVAIYQHFPHVDRMVPSDYIILNALILRIIIFIQFPQKILKLATVRLPVSSFLVIAAFPEGIVPTMHF